MKFVRWLGAFGSGPSIDEAASWEISQLDRQVAVEPLWRGRSLLDHAKIGLVVDHQSSVFVKAWTRDAYTTKVGAVLKTRGRDGDGRQQKAFRNLDRFLSYWTKMAPYNLGHGEAVFDAPVYSAVVVKSTATERGLRRAKKLADITKLPLVVLQVKDDGY